MYASTGQGLHRPHHEPHHEPLYTKGFRTNTNILPSNRITSKYLYNQPTASYVNNFSHHPLNTISSFTYRQSTSGYIDDSLHHPFHDTAESEETHQSSGELARVLSYDCQHEGCYAFFPSQRMLNKHSKVHTGNSLPQDGVLLNLPGNDSGLGAFPYEPVAMNARDPYGRLALAMDGSLPDATLAPEASQGVLRHDKSSSRSNTDAVVSREIREIASTPPNAVPAIDPLPNNRLTCSHPGCNTTCARPGDLRRHLQKHVDGPKAFECPKEGCPRKGAKGFNRKDKMMDHAKVCQGRARGKYRG